MRKLTAFDARGGDNLGLSVAVSGDTAVVGAYNKEIFGVGDSDPGAAYVFLRDQGGAGNWGEVTKLTDADAPFVQFARFGVTAAISNGIAVVGAPLEVNASIKAGAAYVFDLQLTKKPFKGDTDGDGCADVNENLPKSEVANGGGRDYLNPWDFYDIGSLGGGPDGYIDLLFDILPVIQHYSPGGAPPYDVQFDRGPSSGPNPWNMTAPDGVIDLLTDILGVIQQFGHDCR